MFIARRHIKPTSPLGVAHTHSTHSISQYISGSNPMSGVLTRGRSPATRADFARYCPTTLAYKLAAINKAIIIC